MKPTRKVRPALFLRAARIVDDSRSDLMLRYACNALANVPIVGALNAAQQAARDNTPENLLFAKLFKPARRSVKSCVDHGYWGPPYEPDNTKARVFALLLAYEIARA